MNGVDAFWRQIEDVEAAALSLGLLPWQAERLSLRQLKAMQDADQRRQDREWYRAAVQATWIIHWIILASGTKRARSIARKVTPDKLLGRDWLKRNPWGKTKPTREDALRGLGATKRRKTPVTPSADSEE